MPKRIAIVTNGVSDLLTKIQQFKANQKSENVYFRGDSHFQSPGTLNSDLQYLKSKTENELHNIDEFLQGKDWKNLAPLWVSGVDVDWQDSKQMRYPFPEYPIVKEREFWISRTEQEPNTVEEKYLMLVN